MYCTVRISVSVVVTRGQYSKCVEQLCPVQHSTVMLDLHRIAGDISGFGVKYHTFLMPCCVCGVTVQVREGRGKVPERRPESPAAEAESRQTREVMLMLQVSHQ